MSEEANMAIKVLWVEWIPQVTKAGNSKDYLFSPRHLISRQKKKNVFTLERAYSAAVYKNIEPKNIFYHYDFIIWSHYDFTEPF